MASFWEPKACDQTVLPDRSVLIGQKLAENAKIQSFKFDTLSNFQTMWIREYLFQESYLSTLPCFGLLTYNQHSVG